MEEEITVVLIGHYHSIKKKLEIWKMIISKKEELIVLQMYNDVCSENKETLSMIHLAERIIKKRKKWCERGKR
jgi:hypothetical protein